MRSAYLGGAMAIGLLLAAPAFAQCDPGTKLDKTTATDARKKMEAAGYRQVKDLKKGCDSAWHGRAVNRQGAPVDVMITPQGDVLLETNP